MVEFKNEYTLCLEKADTLLQEIFNHCSQNSLCFSIVNAYKTKEVHIFTHQATKKILINLTDDKKHEFAPSKIIAVIGPDGVGKTTLFNTVKPHIRKNFVYKRFKKIVRRSIIYNVTYPFTKRFLTSKLGFKPSKDQHDDAYPKLVFAAGLSYYPYLLFLAKLKKRLVFIDRYFHDYLLENIAFMQKQTVLRKGWQNYLKFLPVPLMTLHLDAKEEVVRSRKEELNDKDIQKYREVNFFCICKSRQKYILTSIRKMI
jgi:thymidylate kinase